MLYEEMNNLQKIVSCISGYCGLGEAGAREDYFYDLEKEVEQIDFVISYSTTVDDVEIVTAEEAKKIVDFLTCDISGQDAIYWAFQAL